MFTSGANLLPPKSGLSVFNEVQRFGRQSFAKTRTASVAETIYARSFDLRNQKEIVLDYVHFGLVRQMISGRLLHANRT
jgi:hypothetical protein